MDYKKKYNEAQKWIESIYSELSHEHQMEAESFFPELKESEDERIRKRIIHALHGDVLDMEETTKAISWLEKQGEQKSIDNLTQQEAMDIAVAKCFNEGEQKPANKVEPKFHEGDWITCEELNTALIVNIVDDKYEVEFVDGNKGFPHIDYVDRLFHLWTIKDAKDGDVLACPLPKGCESGEQIFIFKGINSRDYVDNCIEYYCRVYEGVFYENENGNGYMGTTSSPLYPATKEQRNLLFQKIKDAGYKWDEGKKELMKISKSIWRNDYGTVHIKSRCSSGDREKVRKNC